jgi:Na+-translocating ferredoxin:NAD+ oxidoreductase subunit G
MSSKKINIVYLGLFLGVTCALSTAIMGVVAEVTQAPIAAARQVNLVRSLQAVLPEFDDEPVHQRVLAEDQEPVDFYLVKKAGNVIGVAGLADSRQGYAGRVRVMVGLEVAGSIKTVLVTEQNETPGLGTQVTDRVRQKTIFTLFSAIPPGLPPNKILDQFTGHSAAATDAWKTPWKVTKDGGDVDFITGATVTTRAVTDAVYRIETAWMKHQHTLLAK